MIQFSKIDGNLMNFKFCWWSLAAKLNIQFYKTLITVYDTKCNIYNNNTIILY